MYNPPARCIYILGQNAAVEDLRNWHIVLIDLLSGETALDGNHTRFGRFWSVA